MKDNSNLKRFVLQVQQQDIFSTMFCWVRLNASTLFQNCREIKQTESGGLLIHALYIHVSWLPSHVKVLEVVYDYAYMQ